MTSKLTIPGALALGLLFAFARPALADATGGTVLRVDADRAYVDLGAEDGVGTGSHLELLHEVTVKDPVTGATLRDRFPLGRLTVIKAGPHLCLASIPDKLRHRIATGDPILLADPRRRFVDPWQEQVERSQRAARAAAAAAAPAQPAAPVDPRLAARRDAEQQVAATEAVRAAWQSTLGRPPEQRVAIWNRFLRGHPDSPYAGSVRAEIASLRRQVSDQAAAEKQHRDPERRRTELRVARLAALDPDLDTDGSLAVHAPQRIYQGQSIDLAFTVLDPARVDRAWLYFRRVGEPTYQRVALSADGDAYLHAAIPGDTVAPPDVEYFVDVARGNAQPRPAVGSENHPRRIPVEATVEESAPEIEGRSRVTVLLDYVDFDGRLTRGFDQYSHGEIDFMYRFRRPIYAMRVGFGNLQGMGGPKDVIDADPNGTCRDPDSGLYMCRRVAFSYAYTELEFRTPWNVALMLRPQFGTGYSDAREGASRGRCNGSDTDDCDIFSALGLRARIRFGQETGTNLVLGFAFTEKVGSIFEATYAWSVIPHFPVLLSAQVTDLPVPEDFGVRLIADVGWRALGWVYPSLRLSYQARDVDHSGFSGGLAANFDW